ncbi:hypothetical protein CV102_10655 [Natronococcus pandeyae]|uniref:Uncharacterized protein n=1 Tax=Natronococcus pandeyae TaxID=2055836 RepID=A0A8J8Q885_9EURY|nr:hypothetical protein CV102_10655 [Natronococcus pandeyae]
MRATAKNVTARSVDPTDPATPVAGVTIERDPNAGFGPAIGSRDRMDLPVDRDYREQLRTI